MATLLEKIKTHEAKVAVIGIGYVGLPLCVEMAKAGFRTTGYDKHEPKVKSVNAGKSYIGDISDAVLAPLVAVGQARRVDRSQGARRCRRGGHLRAHAAQQDQGAGQLLHHDGGRGSEAAAAQGHADRPRVARPSPASRARSCCPSSPSRGSRSARTSSSASRPSASIRATRSIRPRTRPRWSAAPRRAASRRSRPCTATSSSTLVPVSSTDAAEMVQAAREHLPRGQHRPGQRGGDHVPQARHEHLGGHRRGGDQAVRLHEVLPGAGARRTLHPRRSAVPVVEAAHAQVRGALHRRSPTRSTRTCRTWSSRRRRTRSTSRRRRSTARKVLVLGDRLQEGHRRRARVAGARRHRAARSKRAPTSATTIRTARRCRSASTR